MLEEDNKRSGEWLFENGARGEEESEGESEGESGGEGEEEEDRRQESEGDEMDVGEGVERQSSGGMERGEEEEEVDERGERDYGEGRGYTVVDEERADLKSEASDGGMDERVNDRDGYEDGGKRSVGKIQAEEEVGVQKEGEEGRGAGRRGQGEEGREKRAGRRGQGEEGREKRAGRRGQGEEGRGADSDEDKDEECATGQADVEEVVSVQREDGEHTAGRIAGRVRDA
ncbi:unnamed protein product [Closterium sp. Yama58-4]|nr:unnamed protein product [Closterium sp. Yama58-4]